MSSLQFDRPASMLRILGGDGAVIGEWPAANNVDSRSKGPWPDGIFDFSYYHPHPGDDANSSYGSNGIFIFAVADREGMGVHSGRATIPDGAGRSGYQHCTLGCIRTTDAGTAQLVRTHSVDPIRSISVHG